MQNTNRKILPSDLTPNTIVMVRGNVSYCRITRKVSGPELERENERKRREHRQDTKDKPYTYISLDNAQVMYQNPQAPTLEEQFINQRMYQSDKKNGIWCYSQYDTSPYSLPKICVMNGNTAEELNAEDIHGELDSGLQVMVEIRIFKTSYANCGLGINKVIALEPIRFYGRNNGAGLAAFGLNFKPAERPLQDTNVRKPENPAQPAQPGMNNNQSYGQNYAGQMNYGQPMNQRQTYASYQQQAQPSMQQAPQNESPFTSNNGGMNGQAYGNPNQMSGMNPPVQQTKMPYNTNQPAEQPGQTGQVGVSFDPNNRGYDA